MKNKKLAIVVAISGIFAVIIFFLIFFPVENEEYHLAGEGQEKMPLLEARGVSLVGWDRGEVKSWTLEAKNAVQFSDKTVLSQVEATLFEEGEAVSEGSANQVIMEGDTSNLRLKGNVEIVSHRDAARLETSELFWDDTEKQLYTEQEITLTRGDFIIKGKGMIAKPDLSLVILKHQVTTYYEGGD